MSGLRGAFNRRIWDPLGHIFRFKTIGDLSGLWKAAWLQKLVVAMLGIAVGLWQWALKRSAPEAIALILVVTAVSLGIRRFVSKPITAVSDNDAQAETGSNLWFIIPVSVVVVVLAVIGARREFFATPNPAPEPKAKPQPTPQNIAAATTPQQDKEKQPKVRKSVAKASAPTNPDQSKVVPEPAVTASSEKGMAIGPVTIQPGGAASFGQRGGITVGQINEAPHARVVVSTIESSVFLDGVYRSKFSVMVYDSQVPKLGAMVTAASLVTMDMLPEENNGVTAFQASRLIDGKKTYIISGAFGGYIVTATTRDNDRMDIYVDCTGVICDIVR